jgi:hypothetical protein
MWSGMPPDLVGGAATSLMGQQATFEKLKEAAERRPLGFSADDFCSRDK